MHLFLKGKAFPTLLFRAGAMSLRSLECVETIAAEAISRCVADGSCDPFNISIADLYVEAISLSGVWPDKSSMILSFARPAPSRSPQFSPTSIARFSSDRAVENLPKRASATP
jgi:hypothetical protein